MLKKIEQIDKERTLVIEFSEDMSIVSTIPLGTRVVRYVVIKNVDKEFDVDNYINYSKSILHSLGIDIDKGLVFATSVPIEEYVYLKNTEPSEIHVIATIGFKPPVCIEIDKVFKPLAIGTINIVVAVDAPLFFEAMVDLLRVVAEAKTIASSDLMLRCRSRASGTATDAIAILRPFNRSEKILFAGMATDIGNTVAKMIHKAILAKAREKFDIDTLLSNVIGLDRLQLVKLVVEAYRYAPIPNVSDNRIRELAFSILNKLLKDANIWSILIAARELDLHGVSETIPYLSKEEFYSDTVKIVADEVLGIALSLYIAGIRGLFSMYWIENLKKSNKLGIELPMFEDDIVSALIGSILTLIYNKLLEER